MNLIRQHKITCIYVGVFLLAGIFSLLQRTKSDLFNTLMYCANAAILLGLILFWMHTVKARLLPTRMRSSIYAAGLFILLYYLIRLFRYRIVVNAIIPARYAGYAYYVPKIMIPAFLLSVATDIALGENKAGKFISRITLLISGVISLISLTNDLHYLVYVPKTELTEFNLVSGTYSWGLFFYVIYGWTILMLVAGFILMIKAVAKRRKSAVLSLFFSMAIWIGASLVCTLIFDRFNLAKMYGSTEIDCFSMILIFECCIRNRLIPYNENYTVFINNLKTPIFISDFDCQIVVKSTSSINVRKETLVSAVHEPVYLDEDTRLSCTRIRAGYVFWIENEHELHEEQRHLNEANALLSEENELINVENKLKEQKARLDAQDMVYARIADAIAPKQKRIETLLDNTDPDNETFAADLGIICVLNAYSKRKTNLLLQTEDTLPNENRELFLALSESARFLKCCDIDAVAIGEEYSQLPLSDIHDLYDTFETVIETYLPVLKKMTVSIMPDGVRMAMEAENMIGLPETKLPVRCTESDGLLFFTVRTRTKDGDLW